ncbi:AvrE-family type 3 secretion system effector [Vibrio nitrifigilis]|uniref:AvrE-family type 3 secretion system effector n=1 Tax=Vibrio nitrifigilis TaxID=2789781 RepID=A0ABS0G9J9_9VIBR|nr:AvrE-family type 3 secretion system effector [Vibrio nitrifigilis]MBF8999075.1 AvrE-family type 3 secretion system effector [Vibrio nitrifigilis]
MKIGNSAHILAETLQASQAAQSTTQSNHPNLQLVQQNAQPQHNQVATLAAEGSHLPLPKDVTQLESTPDGLPVAKHQHKKHHSLAELLKKEAQNDAQVASGQSNRASSSSAVMAEQPDQTSTSAHSASQTQQPDVLDAPELTLKNGKISIGEGTAKPVAALLKGTLGKSQQSYMVHHSAQNGAHQWLQDTKGSITFVETDKQAGLLAMHKSKPITTAHMPVMGRELESTHTPSNAMLSHTSGVYQDESGQQARLHDGKLYTLSEHGTWQEQDHAQGKLSKLAKQPQGALFAVADGKHLTQLGTQSSLNSEDKSIDGFGVNQQGKIALLFKGGDDKPVTIEFHSSIDDKNAQSPKLHFEPALKTEQTKDESPDIQSLGIDDHHVYAIDKENRLLKADLPQQGQNELTFHEMKPSELKTHLGDDIQLQGFLPDDNGKVALLVKDHSGQEHACPMMNHREAFTPGWNLSDVLHIDNTQGLKSVDQQTLDVEDFGRQGKMALHDNKLFAKDPQTQTWREQADNIDSLQRGQDGQAYALQKGQLKKVTVNEKSGAIRFGKDNLFSLHHTKGDLSLDDGPKAMPEGKIKAAAVINSNQHVALTDKGELVHTHLRSGTSQPINPAHPVTQKGLTGEVKQLTIDKNANLYALNDEGKVFKLSKKDWQGVLTPQENHTWKPVDVPQSDGKIQQLSLNAKRKVTLTTDNHQTLELGKADWQSTHTEDPTTNVSKRDNLFSRLSHATKGTKVTKHGAQVNVTAQMGGMSGAEGGKINSKWTSRLKAHVFQPTMDVPRPLQTFADSTQHNWKGRNGLDGLYKQQHALYEELDLTSKKIQAGDVPERPPLDLKTRLEKLDLGDEAKGLKAAIENLRHHAESSAEHQLMTLGQHQGIIDDEGAMKFDYKPSKTKAFTQSFNINRSGHSLTDELLPLWKHTPASKESVPGDILTSFSALKLNMSHEKTEIPLGRRRDSNDQMSLVKARLVLDSLTLQKLDGLVEKAELLSGSKPSTEQLAKLEKDFLAISDKGYEQSPVKQASDKGMQSSKQAEENYDVTKYFTRAMKDENHGVNLITRTSLESKNQTELNQDLKSLLHSLKPSDDVNVSRGYSVDASVTFVPTALQGQAVNMFPTAGVSEKRNYSIDFNGQEDGVQVTLSGNLGPAASANFGISKNTLPYILNQPGNDFKTSLNNGQQSFKPDVMVGAGITANASHAKDNEITFTLKGNDIDEFVDGLTNGTLKANDLIAKGQEHASIHGTKTSFTLDMAVNIGARARLDLKKTDDNTTYLRAGVGLSAGLNLATATKDHLQTQGIDNGKTAVTSKNGLLNTATAGASADVTLGNNQSFEAGLLPMPGKMAVSASAAIDNAVRVKGEMRTKQAEPVTDEAITKLGETLTGAFPDKSTAHAIKEIEKLPTADKKLEAINKLFAGDSPRIALNDTQHSALNDLHKTNIQHDAAKINGSMLGDCKMAVTNYNPQQMDKLGAIDFLASLIAPSHKRALTEKITHMMQQDPDFASIVNKARSHPNTHTMVTLELKDDVRQKLEKNFAKGKINMDEVKKTLENPENRRIKSIAVMEKGSHKEGFSAPTPLISGSSSATIYMERDAGSINFKYGRDQEVPRTYTVGGEITNHQTDITSALVDLKKQGMEVKA